MIYVDMKGNLGNQLFIYACARKIQKITGDTIAINTYYLKKHFPNYKFNLDLFKLNENVIIEDVNRFPFYATSRSKFFKIYSKLTFRKNFFKKLYFKFFSHFNAFVWEGLTYMPIKLRKRKNIYLSGYWQCEKYFDDIRDLLIDELELKEGISPKNEKFLETIKNSNSVCVSIRRGDFLNSKFIDRYYVCDEKYFDSAFEVIKNKIDDPTIVCFSDEPSWAKDNIKLSMTTYFEDDGNSIGDKIILMKNCKHFVLSNSSFSWWVEYLCTNDSKFVVAPNMWYADNSKADILQDYWYKIEVNKK